MGMYTGLRFKGIVKEKYRKGFECIAIDGDWNDSEWEIFKEFSHVIRSGFIPCGSLAYMPDEWESKKEKEATDGFDRQYDEETGYWAFQCSLKNYASTIESFFELVPEFIEKIIHCETFYEEDAFSCSHDIVDGKLIMDNPRFIQYQEEDFVLYWM